MNSRATIQSPFRKKSLQEGLTLLEILVSILIITLVIGAMTFISPLLLGRKSDNNTYAYNAARQGIEAYRSYWSVSQNFDTAAPPPNISAPLKDGCTMAEPQIENYMVKEDGTFDSVELNPPSGTAVAPNVRRVILTVSCPKVAGVTLQTEISDPAVDVQ